MPHLACRCHHPSPPKPKPPPGCCPPQPGHLHPTICLPLPLCLFLTLPASRVARCPCFSGWLCSLVTASHALRAVGYMLFLLLFHRMTSWGAYLHTTSVHPSVCRGPLSGACLPAMQDLEEELHLPLLWGTLSEAGLLACTAICIHSEKMPCALFSLVDNSQHLYFAVFELF